MHTQSEKGTSMNQHPFSLFINLVTLDQKIRATSDEITALKLSMLEHTEQKQQLVDRLERFRQHTREIRKEIDMQELEMKALDQQERTKREMLEHARNVKEYQPLKKEIDTIKRAQNHAESVLVGLWNKHEVAQKELESQQALCDTKVNELHAVLAQKHDAIEVLQQTLDQLNVERPATEAGVPREWLEKYTHMRMSVADPVVPSMRGGCSACFYAVSDQELMRLKRCALVQCKGCFRLLYMQDAMNNATGATDQK